MNMNTEVSNSYGISVLSIIGIGLIGSSFALSLRKSGYNGAIIGVDNNDESINKAKSLNIIDENSTIEDAVKKSDLIMLSTPVSYTKDILYKIRPFLSPHTVITDVGSTKIETISAAHEVLGLNVNQFIPAHPIAGIEKRGPDAAYADLFKGQNVIITPLIENDSKNIAIVKNIWSLCGANVISMSPEDHDRIFASVSHLPHLLSFMYMSQIASSEDVDIKLSMAGSGFRDFTRIAASSSDMWRDIFFSNKKYIKKELEMVLDFISKSKEFLDNDKKEELQLLLENASVVRRNWFGK